MGIFFWDSECKDYNRPAPYNSDIVGAVLRDNGESNNLNKESKGE